MHTVFHEGTSICTRIQRNKNNHREEQFGYFRSHGNVGCLPSCCNTLRGSSLSREGWLKKDPKGRLTREKRKEGKKNVKHRRSCIVRNPARAGARSTSRLLLLKARFNERTRLFTKGEGVLYTEASPALSPG